MDVSDPAMAGAAIVLIGRNEGERLKRCILSAPPGVPVVYVDSGSTDGSVAFARDHGVMTVELDTSIPFSAARARNAGWRALQAQWQAQGLAVDYVQFVDGDCEIVPGWIEAALAALRADPRLAVVFGRRRERFPERSIYNRMCDDEWNVPVGPALSCGGDALFRWSALEAAGGYSDDLVAGEEPDLCLRLRQQGWQIERIDREMTLHDAAILCFGSWWKRARRSGFSYAAHCLRHGERAIPDWKRQLRSIVIWGGLLPALALAGVLVAATGRPLGLLVTLAVLGLLVLQWLRLSLRKWRSGAAPGFAWRYGALIVLGKFAELGGAITCWRNHWRGRQNTLIEYKTA